MERGVISKMKRLIGRVGSVVGDDGIASKRLTKGALVFFELEVEEGRRKAAIKSSFGRHKLRAE